jgi:peroxiredoxin
MIQKLASIATLLFAFTAAQLSAGVTCGEKAPDFSLPSVNGKDVSLASYHGHYVVLEWFNHNCPFVQKFYSTGSMQKWQAQYTAKGVVWLTIDSTNPLHTDYVTAEQERAVYTQMKLASSELLRDTDGKVGHLYGATNTPHIFIVDPNGVLIYQGAVDDNRSTDGDDVDTAHNYLKAALDEVLAGKQVSISSSKPYGCSVKFAK